MTNHDQRNYCALNCHKNICMHKCVKVLVLFYSQICNLTKKALEYDFELGQIGELTATAAANIGVRNFQGRWTLSTSWALHFIFTSQFRPY